MKEITNNQVLVDGKVERLYLNQVTQKIFNSLETITLTAGNVVWFNNLNVITDKIEQIKFDTNIFPMTYAFNLVLNKEREIKNEAFEDEMDKFKKILKYWNKYAEIKKGLKTEEEIEEAVEDMLSYNVSQD